MGIENHFESNEHPTCDKCNGTGTVTNDKGKKVTCDKCGGSGKIK